MSDHTRDVTFATLTLIGVVVAIWAVALGIHLGDVQKTERIKARTEACQQAEDVDSCLAAIR